MNSETHFLVLVSLLYTEQGYTQITRGINTKYHYIYRRSKLSQAMWGPQQVTMTCRFFFSNIAELSERVIDVCLKSLSNFYFIFTHEI